MIVLKIIGWTLLGILALIVLALCIRLLIEVEYSDDDTHVTLRWLFLKVPLYPAAPKAPKKKAPKEEEPPKEEKPEEEKPAQTEKKEGLLHILYRTHGVDGLLELARKTVSYLNSFFGGLIRAAVIEELYLDVGCTKGDAAATAIYYGEVCSALFPLLGALASKCKIKKYDVNVYPDYLARFSRASFFVKFHVYPIYVTGITLLLVFRLVFRVLLGMLVKVFLPKKDKNAEKENITKEKEDESHEGSDSGRNPVNNDRESPSAG